VGHKEYRFDLFVELPIHQRHLEFVFEVGKGAETTNDNSRSPAMHIIHQKTVKGFDRDTAHSPDGIPNDPLTLRKAEKRGLVWICTHRDDKVRKEAVGSPGDIDVSKGKRIEGPGVDSQRRHIASRR
jgi:hypothetical protein